MTKICLSSSVLWVEARELKFCKNARMFYNMWKVYTLLTSASDFIVYHSFRSSEKMTKKSMKASNFFLALPLPRDRLIKRKIIEIKWRSESIKRQQSVMNNKQNQPAAAAAEE
jgi:hypothetical protein